MLRNLKAEMARSGLRTNDLVLAINRSEKAVRMKIAGESSFTFPEALTIRATFFPELALEYLFADSD